MPRVVTRTETKIFLAVFLLGFGFVLYTQHAWEDFWIAFRTSRNLATGQGAVYVPGERLQTYTSPLGMLLPAGLSWLTGNGPEDVVLWLFRLVSLAALAGGATILYAILKALAIRPKATGLTLALLALDSKILDFSTNGMETGLLIFFLALTLHGMLVSGPRQIPRIGLGWAGLMWTRPDSCVYIAALGVGALLFLRPGQGNAPSGTRLPRLLQAGLICLAMYLPWFLWAWWYYGSPLPHTILAKGTNSPPRSRPGLAVNFPFRHGLDHKASVWWTFLPSYASTSDWPMLLIAGYALAAWAAALAWLCPLFRPVTRMLSFVCYTCQFFLTDVVRNFYPWYLPGVAVLEYLVLGLMFDQLLSRTERPSQPPGDRRWTRLMPAVRRGVPLALLAVQLALTACVARLTQQEQRWIENGVRRSIGQWLHDHAAPQDTVLLEPLGYIGYYSGLKTLDYPGLSSRKVVEVRRHLGPEKERLAWMELNPDWLVLRQREADGKSFIDAHHLKDFYDLVMVEDASDQLPIRTIFAGDAKFLVFHRKSAWQASQAIVDVFDAAVKRTGQRNTLAVTAYSTTPGWRQVGLRLVDYSTPTADGIQDVILQATPPASAARPQVQIYDLSAELPDAARVRGVRISDAHQRTLQTLRYLARGAAPIGKDPIIFYKDAQVKDGKLLVKTRYCGGASHELQLSWDGSSLKSFPHSQVTLHLSHNANGDPDRNPVTEWLTFVLSPPLDAPEKYVINLEANGATNLVYEP